MSDGGASKNTGVSVKVSVGKEIDKSVAGVLSALLMPGATEIGKLFGDGIGLIADVVRAKREQNARLGFERVRERLESAEIKLTDVTPPKEEELHLLISGLSLSDDTNVRDLWAGLFAKAIDPNSNVAAERSFIVALQSLSPTDAKIIDFLAFVSRTDAQLSRAGRAKWNARRKNAASAPTDAPADAEEQFRILYENAIQGIRDKAKAHAVDNLSDGAWAENLMRLGLIEPRPEIGMNFGGLPAIRSHGDTIDVGKLERKIAELEKTMKHQISTPSGLFSDHTSRPMIEHFGISIILTVRFTNFGARLAKSCDLL